METTKDKPRIKVGKMGKKSLTREGKRWLIEHYPHTKNEEIAAALGVCSTTLRQFRLALQLKKSKEFMRQASINASEIAKEVNEATGYDAQRRAAKEQYRHWLEEHPGEERKGGFKKGHVPRVSPETYQNIAQKLREHRARDRRRIELGLAPLTRLVPEYMLSKSEIHVRNYLKTKLGYVVFRKERTIYYSPDTRRNLTTEARYKAKGYYFQPIEGRRDYGRE